MFTNNDRYRIVRIVLAMVLIAGIFGMRPAQAMTVSFGWTHRFGTPSYDFPDDFAFDIYIDALGYLYSTRRAGGAIFINKPDNNENFLWAKSLSGSGYNNGEAIAVDNVRNVHLARDFSGTVDVDLSAGTHNRLSLGFINAFLGKSTFTSQVYYVKWNASGLNDGTSWTNAYTDLQSALTAASCGDEIWVAEGTYKPTINTDRSISFVLKNGVKIYGGFWGIDWGNDDPRTNLRNPEKAITILSGDIGLIGDNSDNSYHVVVGTGTDNSAVLDGFTITAGNADGDPNPLPGYYPGGGGIFNYVGSPSLANLTILENNATWGGGMYNLGCRFPSDECFQSGSSPILTNVTFIQNTAIVTGGMRNEGYSSPTLTNVKFINNSASRTGGGMENYEYSNAILTNVVFDGNHGGYGAGGLGNIDSNAILTNVTFSNNSAIEAGGAVMNAGSSSTFTNVTFSGNSAEFGGGMWNYHADPVLTNVTFKSNSAITSGGGIHSEEDSNVSVQNTILWANTAPNGSQIYNDISVSIVSNSVVQGGFVGGTNIITTDPLLGSLADNGGFTETIALGDGSPTIDAGTNDGCPGTDQRGVKRPQNGQCDIGAYEYGNSIVTKIDDTDDHVCDNDCSLREAIEVAPGGGIIHFAPSLSGQTITLDTTLLLYKDVTIDSSTLASKIAVSGNNSVTVFEIDTDSTVLLKSLIIKNGKAVESYIGNEYAGILGGGIKNYGMLSVLNSVIQDNHAADGGGGIFSTGLLNLDSSTILNNAAGYIGGGIYTNGSLEITNSTISDNTACDAGGVFAFDATLTNNIISNNSATCSGGGVLSMGILNVADSSFTNNSAAFGGGAILGTGAEMNISNSTIAENTSAGAGGGVSFGYGALTVTNSTFTGNSAIAGEGGGIISHASPLALNNSTFSDNSASTGGSAVHNLGTLKITNTILANSISGSDCYNDANSGTIQVNVNNLIETNASAPHSCGVPLLTGDPKLGPLENNGGFTETMALDAGSPAINAGTNDGCSSTDQRGVKRPQGGVCDIGAYEYRSDPTFSDVPSNHWAWFYIEELYSASVTSGCGVTPLRYCPSTIVTRDQMAVFLLKAKYGSGYTPPVATGVFADVPTNYWASSWIEQLAAEGITSGCSVSPQRYCPSTAVTRDQMAVFLLKAKHGSNYVPPSPTGVFADVPASYWSASWIEQLAIEGITAGCGGSNYCPATPVTRDQMAVFLVKNFNLP